MSLQPALPVDPSFEALLDFLKHSRGIDFTGYKRPSLERRVRRRLEIVGCRSFGEYLEHLEVDADEFDALFDTLLINVTQFFRDPPSWAFLREQVLPELVRRKPDDEPIRVWSAGCASGQEAYTIAMCLAEVLGVDAFKARVKIYGTDIDEDALDTARGGTFTAKELESVPERLRDAYFERAGQRFAFRKELRRTVVFGRNNLVQDAPISRLDLLVCRNTLIYLTAETQGRIVRHFHFALRDGGVLMLGRSEVMLAHRDLFAAIDVKQRIFAKRDVGAGLQTRLTGTGDDHRSARDAALELGPLPQLIVSRAGALTFANRPARALFELGANDLGRHLEALDLSVPPAELAASLEESLRERRRVVVGEVPFGPEQGDQRRLAITVVPLVSDGGPPLGAALLFEDVTGVSRMQHELDGHRHELEQAHEALQSTIDELEDTNEELQSANEELQSTNEALETINDELRDRASALHDVNDFFEAILTSLGIAVAVVDRDQRVQVWNHRAEDLWGVRGEEALEHDLRALDIGLPTEPLARGLRAIISGASPRERVALDAVNRRGRSIVCMTTLLPLRHPRAADGTVVGAIILMEETRVDGSGDAAARPGGVVAPSGGAT